MMDYVWSVNDGKAIWTVNQNQIVVKSHFGFAVNSCQNLCAFIAH